MSIQADKVIERSVDSIQKIYAVVIALAISQSFQSLLKEPSGGALLGFAAISPALPSFLAFLVTLVPFWHGMNRHLDRCYLEKTSDVVQGALLLDFVVFFVEAGCLFAAAWSLRSGIESFAYLGVLLSIDTVWAFVSHQIHYKGQKSNAIRWSLINLIAMSCAIGIVAFPFESKPIVLMVVAILRSVADYGICWNFYFPRRIVSASPAS
jgi:hypothetical protein